MYLRWQVALCSMPMNQVLKNPVFPRTEPNLVETLAKKMVHVCIFALLFEGQHPDYNLLKKKKSERVPPGMRGHVHLQRCVQL